MDDLSHSYEVLEITPPATEDQVKRAYRDMVKVWHPDRFLHDERLRLKAQDKLKEINGAYKFLLANLFAESAVANPEPGATPGPSPENPPPPPAPEAVPAGRWPARWAPWAAIAFLVLAAAWLAYLIHSRQVIKAHQDGQPALSPPIAPALPDELHRGLILDFHFDKELADGKIADLSGHGNDGQAVGVQWVADGRQGGALEFGAGESYIRVADKESLNPPQFTLAAWIKTSEKGPVWRRIFDKGAWDTTGGETGYDLTMGGDEDARSWRGRVLLEVSARAAFSIVPVADGNWRHVAGTFDGTNLQLFVNGRLVGHNHVKLPMEATSYDLTIGHPRSPHDEKTAGFIGLMNDVMMFDRVLSATEVRELFQAQGGEPDRRSAPPPPAAATSL